MFPTYSEWLKAATDATASTSVREHGSPVSEPSLPVLVIGAGPAGLAVMAELTSRSIAFACMEQSAGVGGMWDKQNNARSPVYPSLYSNVSKFSMTLSKPFDMPEHWPPYLPHELVLAYLQGFADRHGVKPHIRFNHRVTRCEYDEQAQRWVVGFTGTADGKEASESFSDVIVATGQNNRNSAALPSQLFAEAKQSGLLVRHTSQYEDGEEFRDKRVLIVGLGISGAGIASLVSRVARRTYVAVRTPQYLIPQWLLGYPWDQATAGNLPDLSGLPHWLSSTLLWIGRHVLNGVEYLFGNKTAALGMRRPQHSILDKGAVVTDDSFEAAVLAKQIVLRPEVVTFTPGRAVYTTKANSAVVAVIDGDDIDAVIFATGYTWSFPFLPPSLHPTTCTPSVVDFGRQPSACYNVSTTRASSLTLNLISPANRHLYFMIEVVHVYSAWPIFATQARAIVSSVEARRRGSERAGVLDRVSKAGFANPSFSGPWYKSHYWKDGDEYYVDRGLYETFLLQFCEWLEERSIKASG